LDKSSDNLKILSADDVLLTSKSFRLKGEFSKSLGTVYHFPPPSTSLKNDTKTKIYWYHRRKELKAEKEKDKVKSQSVDSFDRIISHPLHPQPHKKFSNQNTPKNPAPVNTHQFSQPRIPAPVKFDLQDIQQQEKEFQQQHQQKLAATSSTNNQMSSPRVK